MSAGWPYIGYFEDYIRDELDVRRGYTNVNGTVADYNIYRSQRTAWVRLTSNAIANVYGQQYEGMVLSPNRLTFQRAYGYTGEGSVVGYEARYTVQNDKIYHRPIRSLDPDRHRPPTVVSSISVEHAGNYGAFRRATIALSVHTLSQFEVIEKFFLTPGISVALEWGWDDFQKGNSVTLLDVEKSFVDELVDAYKAEESGVIKKKRNESKGKYDLMVGVITNYSYSINEFGVFECEIEISSAGELLTSLAFKNVINLGEKTFISEEEKLPVDVVMNRLQIDLPVSFREDADKQVAKFYKMKSEAVQNANGGVARDRIVDGEPIYYVSWGFIEDYILSTPELNSLGTADNANVSIRVDSRKTAISAHPSIVSIDPNTCIIPNSNAPKFNAKGTGVRSQQDLGAIATPASATDLTINGSIFPRFNSPTGEYVGDIRNIYVNVDLVQSAIEDSNSILDVMRKILDKLEQASCNLWDFTITNNSTVDDEPGDGILITVVDNNFINDSVKNVKQNPKLYKFNFFQTTNVVKSISVQSDLPKDYQSQILFERIKDTEGYNVIHGNPKSVITDPFSYISDRVFDVLATRNREQLRSSTETTPPDAPKKDESNEWSTLLHYMKMDNDVPKTYAIDNRDLMISLMLKDETNVANNFNNNILIPISVEMVLDGISGFKIGDAFELNGVPERIVELGIFQITNITHELNASQWETKITAQLRLMNANDREV